MTNLPKIRKQLIILLVVLGCIDLAAIGHSQFAVATESQVAAGPTLAGPRQKSGGSERGDRRFL